jgi:hypothetical protein
MSVMQCPENLPFPDTFETRLAIGKTAPKRVQKPVYKSTSGISPLAKLSDSYASSGRTPTRDGGAFITASHHPARLSLDTNSAPGRRPNPSAESTAARCAAK